VRVRKVKFSHTRYRALGQELIPVYKQAVSRQVISQPSGGRLLPLLSVSVTSVALTTWRKPYTR